MFAAEIRKRRVAHMRRYPQWRWHLDEVFVKVNGKLCYLWRAVDHEGEVLEAVVTAKRDKAAALKLLKRIMKKYGSPHRVVTDGLRSYSAAMKEIGAADRHEVGGRLNNRAENSHQSFRRRERAMQRFRRAFDLRVEPVRQEGRVMERLQTRLRPGWRSQDHRDQRSIEADEPALERDGGSARLRARSAGGGERGFGGRLGTTFPASSTLRSSTRRSTVACWCGLRPFWRGA